MTFERDQPFNPYDLGQIADLNKLTQEELSKINAQNKKLQKNIERRTKPTKGILKP